MGLGTVSSKRGKAKGDMARAGKVLPKESFRLERLNAIDADVTLRADRIRRTGRSHYNAEIS
jgi:uncharacterized protein involved in outer membrane biogenesis